MSSYVFEGIMSILDDTPRTARQICEIMYPNMSYSDRVSKTELINKTLCKAYERGEVSSCLRFKDGRGKIRLWYAKGTILEEDSTVHIRDRVGSNVNQEWQTTREIAERTFGECNKILWGRTYNILKTMRRRGEVDYDRESKRWRLKR